MMVPVATTPTMMPGKQKLQRHNRRRQHLGTDWVAQFKVAAAGVSHSIVPGDAAPESQQRGLSVSEAHQFNNSADAGEHYTDGLIQRKRPPN
jgi:hypothetical protein